MMVPRDRLGRPQMISGACFCFHSSRCNLVRWRRRWPILVPILQNQLQFQDSLSWQESPHSMKSLTITGYNMSQPIITFFWLNKMWTDSFFSRLWPWYFCFFEYMPWFILKVMQRIIGSKLITSKRLYNYLVLNEEPTNPESCGNHALTASFQRPSYNFGTAQFTC